MIKFCISFVLTVVCLFLSSFQSYSQGSITVPKNSYGLESIKSKELFLKTVNADSNKEMISLKSSVPLLVLDLRYATKNNFMHRRMYPAKTTDTYCDCLP